MLSLASSSSSSYRDTIDTSPQIVHLRAASAVAASTACWASRPIRVAQMKPAANASPAPTPSTTHTTYRVGGRTARDVADVASQRGGHAGEGDEPRSADQGPVHVLRHEAAERGIAPRPVRILYDRRDAVLDEVEPHPLAGTTEDAAAVHPV